LPHGQHADSNLTVQKAHYQFHVNFRGFRFGFNRSDGTPIALPHEHSGIAFATTGSDQVFPVTSSELRVHQNDSLSFHVTNQVGERALVSVVLHDRSARIDVKPEAEKAGGKFTIDVRTAPLFPAYGLGDHGGYGNSTNVFGYKDDDFANRDNSHRFISNFVIFPAQGFAQVLFEPKRKRVELSGAENRQGAAGVPGISAWYFTGAPKEIYRDYKSVCDQEGFPSFLPKYRFFELGYEAFGSLGWNTYQSSVEEDIGNYLKRGYDLRWAVVGSGFWKGARRDPAEGATTSFGIWDDQPQESRNDGFPNPRYPDVNGFKEFFKSRDILLLLGLRINFKAGKDQGGHYDPANDGHFSTEGLKRGYFRINAAGRAEVYKVNFPQGNVHLLDGHNPEAVQWYVEGVDKWGVDGYKEDLMLKDGAKLNDDTKLNPINEALMNKGYYIMARNGAYSVPGDILRLEDTKHGFDQDRPVINALNYAASGAYAVYPDIVAGKYLVNPLTSDQERYFARNAMLAAVSPVMAMGHGPWHLQNELYRKAVKKAADWHSRMAPYIHSAAVKSYKTGFPYTMTPLPLAYPNDTATYELASKSRRQYAWMIGESLLATPLYGNDYATATSRDVYLPEGRWIDYETHKVFDGPVRLPDYGFPVDKLPVFIGGKGVLVYQADGDTSFLATVYPIRQTEFEYIFYYPDGKSSTTIRKVGASWEPSRLEIRDLSTGSRVQPVVLESCGAFSFPIRPGRDYELNSR